MTDPTPLSPAALAVLDAGTMGNPNVINDPVYRQCIAAALRAAADHINNALAHEWSGFNCVDALCEIAAELEGAND